MEGRWLSRDDSIYTYSGEPNGRWLSRDDLIYTYSGEPNEVIDTLPPKLLDMNQVPATYRVGKYISPKGGSSHISQKRGQMHQD